ncbi:SCO2322 family protein [Streptomyces albus]|uniref:SCO2322 family protein n=1 Tax=Streptomyces albus TaxID=1888 RepID=UPI0004C9C8E2|nr:SCO2322 family protein [Streptomyces albus]
MRGAAVLPLAVAVTALGAGPAQAEGYRYWSFWQRDGGSWSYATEGPATARPADGDVEGFRFSVSADSQDAAKPRGRADFDAICAGTPAEDGRKRVALLLDFGTAGDAPDGERPPEPRTECASLPEDATSGEALAAVAKPLRYNTSALLCAIAGYPERGCGEQVSGDAGAGTGGGESSGESGSDRAGDDRAGGDRAGDAPVDEAGGSSTGLYAGAAVVAVLAAGAVWQARRRRG